MAEETTTICESCKMPMDRAYTTCSIMNGLLSHRHEETQCPSCQWDTIERSIRSVRRPYKMPDARRRKDGGLPEEYLKYLERNRKKVCEE